MKTTSFTKRSIISALFDAFARLDPRTQWKNPVMFVTEVGALITTLVFLGHWIGGTLSSFEFQISIWLWFTVLFANFAEALAEGRGKAQAESLRLARSDTPARKIVNGAEIKITAHHLKLGDTVLCETGDTIPGDGEVIEGIATVDESAITGESAPVIRESGGDRSAVTGGTRVVSDRILIRITAETGNSFLDRMIQLVEGASRQKTPNEIALSILLTSLTLVFVVVVVTLQSFGSYSESVSAQDPDLSLSLPILTSLLVCLIPTTIGGLLSAIGISGMDRLIRKNVIATSGRAVEAAGDIDVLLLDKTGTITHGNRMATDFIPSPGITLRALAEKAALASAGDDTPEGKSILLLAKNQHKIIPVPNPGEIAIPFSAHTRMSGIDFPHPLKTRCLRKGAVDAVRLFVEKNGGEFPKAVREDVDRIARKGGTPLVVAEDETIYGVIHLKDVVKSGIKERFSELRKMGIKTIMITGDNPLTAASIAAEAGVDDFMAEATPAQKLSRIREEQERGHLVAMTGDGTNDAPALAQADVGVAMNSGTQAAREAGNMVDLDSDPTKLIEIVETGKQLLMTRGALTTFSIANDIAKYFAILPALFAVLYASNPNSEGPLGALNIMNLHSSESAILSAVIFNALIIVILIPLALKGVKYRPVGAATILQRNVLIYGLGGIIAPFVGIKLVDLILVAGGLI